MHPLPELFFCSLKHAKIGARERGCNGVTGMEKEGMERAKQKGERQFCTWAREQRGD